jgi:PadR family transcriptional regulator, regulatory protein AphA
MRSTNPRATASASATRRLSASASALLGLLAARARTGYELAREMDQTLRFVWPRATSKLYEAPKLLVERGLATARHEHVGRRPRTVYTITPAGQQAVAVWLRSPPAQVELEAEAIVRVWFGYLGSKEDLVKAIDAVHQQAQAGLRHGVRIGQARLAQMPPERGHVAALVFRFLWDYNTMLARWAAWANEEIEDWPDTTPTREKLERAAEILRACLAGEV